MGWSEKDDKDVDESIKKITKKREELQKQIEPLDALINYSQKIKSRKIVSITEKDGRVATKGNPLDIFGDEVDDKERLSMKKKYMSKANELLNIK